MLSSLQAYGRSYQVGVEPIPKDLHSWLTNCRGPTAALRGQRPLEVLLWFQGVSVSVLQPAKNEKFRLVHKDQTGEAKQAESSPGSQTSLKFSR